MKTRTLKHKLRDPRSVIIVPIEIFSEKEAIFSSASANIPIVEQYFANFFGEFEKYFNIYKSLHKLYFKKIVSRLYRKGLFDKNIFKLMKKSSKREARAFEKSLKCYHYTLRITPEKIANTMRRCSSLSDAEIVLEKIADGCFNWMKKIIHGNFKAIIQLRKQLKIRLKIINEQRSPKPATKSAKTSTRNQKGPKTNAINGILQAVNEIPPTKTMRKTINYIVYHATRIKNCKFVKSSDEFDWKYFRKKKHLL